MTSPVPANPKIYHILHVDRLPSIIAANGLLCDAEMARRSAAGTEIGMRGIKQRRLHSRLNSHADLCVGDCVPFYFCPRSVMLYVIHQANHPELFYRGGQGPIIHLEADLRQTVEYAEDHGLRWAFTLSNAGSSNFQDRCDLADLGEIDWCAVRARSWQDCGKPKQAEFLIEQRFSWKLITGIGVCTERTYDRVVNLFDSTTRPVRVHAGVVLLTTGQTAMIEHKPGDIFTADSDALVNPVNCVGVMGRGIALQFKHRFPDNFKAYKTECEQDKMKPGRVFVYETRKMFPPRYIINFPTKLHWRGKSRMEYIDSGLESLVEKIRSHDIRSIAIPALGSGLGKLEWKVVRARMKAALQELEEVEITIFEPGGGPAETHVNRSTDRPLPLRSGRRRPWTA